MRIIAVNDTEGDEYPTKLCRKCNIEKSLAFFYKEPQNADKLCNHCKECRNLYAKEHYNKNKNIYKERAKDSYLKDKTKNKKYCESYRNSDPIKNMLSKAKLRASKKGIPFDLKVDDVFIPEVCPVFNIPLERNTKGKGPKKNSPSLDRIVPNNGYVKGNVQIISNKANLMKQDASAGELVTFAKWVLSVYGDTI